MDLPDKPFSRRGVLSIASSVFDPLGLITPVTIEGKFILRELTTTMKEESGLQKDVWDRPLPETLLPKWKRWRDSLQELSNINIQRCYQPSGFGQVKRREVHVFSDASERAIGAVAYLRVVNEDGQPYVSLLLSKARVTPSHAMSIPRLELCAAVLATTLTQTMEAELSSQMVIHSIQFYSDSKVVLGYIANESKRFHVYVANRVHKIHKASDSKQWSYVPTQENPADLASRSVPADQIEKTRWFQGPEFLWQIESSPHTSPAEPTNQEQPRQLLKEEDPEVRKEVRTSATDTLIHSDIQSSKDGESYLSCERFSRFSSWSGLKRAVNTLINKVKQFRLTRDKKKDGRSDNLEDESSRKSLVEELQDAEKVILKAVQRESFTEELQQLKKTQNLSPAVSKHSPLYRLTPFLDPDGIVRVGGRLRRSDIHLGGRHPMLLPKNHHVSRLIAEYFHSDVRHQGRQLTSAAIRSGGIWIIGAHNLVRNIINRCATCKKLGGKPLTQIMADLPADRLEATPPFTNVGMDVFGPWTVLTRKTRGGAAESKRWALLFTCLCCRGVHVEVMESMDTSSFISALRRFIAIRGAVARLRCDRGTNFVGGKGDLDATLEGMDQEKIAKYLSSQHCEWVFNPPHASHFGGVWERQIRTIRRVLEAMFLQLGKHQLTHEVLITFITKPNLSSGDVVLLCEKDVPRYRWPLARIVKTYPSDDDKVRKADVMTCSEGTRRTYLRPTSQLVLIEKAHVPT